MSANPSTDIRVFREYAKLVEAESKGKKLPGIHEWLSRLWNGVFMPPSGKKMSKYNPITFGRMFDQAVMQFSKPPYKITSKKISPLAVRYAKAVKRELDKMGYSVVKTQQLVCDPVKWKVKTNMDLFCIKDGTLYVVELKTTQNSFESHLKNYKAPCRRKKYMLHGALLNSEYNHHQMQIGAVMCIMKRLYHVKNVQGFVLMTCTDTSKRQRCMMYPACMWAMDERLYYQRPHPLVPDGIKNMWYSGFGRHWMTLVEGAKALVLENLDKDDKKLEDIPALFVEAATHFKLESYHCILKHGSKFHWKWVDLKK